MYTYACVYVCMCVCLLRLLPNTLDRSLRNLKQVELVRSQFTFLPGFFLLIPKNSLISEILFLSGLKPAALYYLH